MPARTIDLGFAFDGSAAQARAPEPAPATVERLTAVLRWRTRWLRRGLTAREAQALRLVPALFQASFPTGDLRGEPPGIEGMTVRRTWGGLARAFDLPPPIARQRGRRLVSALFAARGAKGLELLALTSPGAGTAERARVEARGAAIEELLKDRGLPFQLAVLSFEMADALAEPLLGLVAFGALLAGRLPERFWQPTDRRVSAEALSRLIPRAPSPLCAYALLTMLGAPARSPVDALRSSLEAGRSCPDLADPELSCADWASDDGDRDRLLYQALALSSGRARIRALAAASAGRPEPGPAPPPAEVIALGRALALGCVAAYRRAPREVRARLAPFVRREVLARGVAEPLLPSLARGFRALESRRRGPALAVRRHGRGAFEAFDATGTALSRGATAEQAMLRALRLLSCALGELPTLEEPSWKALGHRLGRQVDRRTLLLAIEAAPALGSPHDPLNRGPDRALGIADVLVVTLRPGGRPCARRLSAERAVELVVSEACAGSAIEAMAVTGEAQPAAARLLRVSHLARNADPLGPPLAIEADGSVLLTAARRMRRYPLARFAARPRHCTPDPEAPDLSPWAEDKLPQSPFGGNSVVVLCHVTRIGEERASVLYVDTTGHQLYEQIPLQGLEEHLADAQSLLRARPNPMLLMIRYSKEIETVVGRWGPTGSEARIELEVCGALPFGLQVHFLAERFGAGQPLGWDAAGQAALSAWPSGATRVLSCKAVTVDVLGRPAVGLWRLYARSVALRRLKLHVGKACRA